MLDIEFGDAVSCLVRLVWAAAAGNLRLASTTSSSGLGSASAHSDQQASRFVDVLSGSGGFSMQNLVWLSEFPRKSRV